MDLRSDRIWICGLWIYMRVMCLLYWAAYRHYVHLPPWAHSHTTHTHDHEQHTAHQHPLLSIGFFCLCDTHFCRYRPCALRIAHHASRTEQTFRSYSAWNSIKGICALQYQHRALRTPLSTPTCPIHHTIPSHSNSKSNNIINSTKQSTENKRRISLYKIIVLNYQ